MATRTQHILDQLAEYESRNVTYLDPDGSWPIVWDRAKGVNVWDAEGRKYLDLTAAFGVAAAGHANPAVVRAGQKQMAKLLHAMGDVHPHALKAELARELSRLTFERWSRISPGVFDSNHPLPEGEGRGEGERYGTAKRPLTPALSPANSAGETKNRIGSKRQALRFTGKTIFGNSGFEAVEASLKTARLATGRKHLIAFRGGYHGLGYGALNATHRQHFSEPFRNQLGGFGLFAGFPTEAGSLKKTERELGGLFRQQKIGAVLLEPVQARGGINIPPTGFLALLRKLCDQHGALLVFDEIYTGFGRTGKWFACEHENVMPDLVCVGKALAGGFPLSACVGRADVMDAAWPKSDGEAIHTSTFLGHPVGCAMALAQLAEIKKRKLPTASSRTGKILLRQLNQLSTPRGFRLAARGAGLMVGLEICKSDGSPAPRESLEIVKRLLHRGFIVLPEGENANVIGFTPSLTISETQLARSVKTLERVMKEVCSS